MVTLIKDESPPRHWILLFAFVFHTTQFYAILSLSLPLEIIMFLGGIERDQYV